jgi:hypothetical protein
MNSCSSSTILPSAGERVPPQVHRPYLARLGRRRQHHSRCGGGPSVSSLAAKPPLQLRIQPPLHPLVVYHPSFAHQFHPATGGSRTGAVLRPVRAAALATGRPPAAAAHTDTSHDESGSARRPVARRPLLASASLSLPAFALLFFFSSSRSGIGKLTRRSRVAKVEIPPQLRDLQAQWESPGPFRGAAFSTAFSPINCAIEFQF